MLSKNSDYIHSSGSMVIYLLFQTSEIILIKSQISWKMSSWSPWNVDLPIWSSLRELMHRMRQETLLSKSILPQLLPEWFLSAACLPLSCFLEMPESVRSWEKEVTHKCHLKHSPSERLGHPGVIHSPWGWDRHLLASVPQTFMFFYLQRFLKRSC